MGYAYYDGRASVYIPDSLGEKKDLPVIVWIHGYLLALLTKFGLIFFFNSQGGGMSRETNPSMETIWSVRRGAESWLSSSNIG